MTTKIGLRCECCGDIFMRPPSQITVNTRYCSRKCATTGAARDKRGPVQFVDDTVLIPLTRDKVAIVDRDDYESLPELKEPWIAHSPSSKFYAWKRINKIFTYMHVYILKPEPGMEVHHRDDNGLNNRRNNIVSLTGSQHKATTTRSKHGMYSSKYRGVTHEKKSARNPWFARITIDGKSRYLGAYPTEETAAREYDRCAIAVFGQFAILNFPHDSDL